MENLISFNSYEMNESNTSINVTDRKLVIAEHVEAFKFNTF